MSLGGATLVMWMLSAFSLMFLLSLPGFISSNVQNILFLMPAIFAILGLAFAMKD